MPKVSKPRSPVRQQDQRPSTTQPSVEIPSNFGELSILELNNLCRELNFSCAGGRRPTGTYNASTERKRTSKHEYAAIQHSNRSSKQHVIYFQREGKLRRRPNTPTKLRRLFRSRSRRSSKANTPQQARLV
jgi:hypothetical protein